MSSTHSDQCNYAYLSGLKLTKAEACEQIGKGICSSGRYVNMYKVYYCMLEQQNSAYFFFMVVFFLYMMFNLNFIRRQYYIQRIQSLRSLLHLPEFVTESLLVPVSYGIVPIFIRILSSIHKIDFGFHMGANIGTIFNLITLFTGVCSMRIGKSPPVNMPMFMLNGTFVLLGNLLHLPLGSRKVLNVFDSACYFVLFIIYMACRYYMARKEKPESNTDSNDDLVDETPQPEKIAGVYAGMIAIAEFVIKVDSEKRNVEQSAIKEALDKSESGKTSIDAERNSIEMHSPVNLISKKQLNEGQTDKNTIVESPERPDKLNNLHPNFMINKENKQKMSETMILFHRKINTVFLKICRKFKLLPHSIIANDTDIGNGQPRDDADEINLQSPVDSEMPETEKEIIMSQLVESWQEEELEKFTEQFSGEFVAEAKSLKFVDRREIVEYAMKNKSLKSSLIIGWELAEIIYQNGYEAPFQKKSPYEKLLAFMYFPIELFTNLTIMPHLNEEDDPLLSKLRLLFNPFFTSFFLAYLITHGADFGSSLFLLVLLLSFTINAAVIYPVVILDRKPSKVFFGLIYINNILMSLLCFFFISDIIVDLFRSLNVIYNFKYAFFTVSLFSTIVWIPAIMGALRTTELMKIVPGYNGAIFNTLLVFGFCVLIHQMLRGEITIHTWPIATDNQSDLCTVFFVINSLVLPVTYWHLRNNEYRYTRILGIYLTAFFFIANGIVLLLGFILVN